MHAPLNNRPLQSVFEQLHVHTDKDSVRRLSLWVSGYSLFSLPFNTTL